MLKEKVYKEADLWEFKASLVFLESPRTTRAIERPYFRKRKTGQAAVAHAFNASSWETDAKGPLRVLGQPELQKKFQDSQGYTEKLCLEKTKKKKEKQNKGY